MASFGCYLCYGALFYLMSFYVVYSMCIVIVYFDLYLVSRVESSGVIGTFGAGSNTRVLNLFALFEYRHISSLNSILILTSNSLYLMMKF